VVPSQSAPVPVAVESAIRLAEEQGLDLVEMSNQNGVSTCKIMDYGKYSYKKKQAEKANRQVNKHITKEYKFGVNITDHDLGIKISHMSEYIDKNAVVKVTIRLRGREMSHPALAVSLAEKISAGLGDKAKILQAMSTEGNTMHFSLVKK